MTYPVPPPFIRSSFSEPSFLPTPNLSTVAAEESESNATPHLPHNEDAWNKFSAEAQLYYSRSDLVNLDSARQSQIEAKRSDRRSPSPSGKGKNEDRFGKVAASPNSPNLTGDSTQEQLHKREEEDPLDFQVGLETEEVEKDDTKIVAEKIKQIFDHPFVLNVDDSENKKTISDMSTILLELSSEEREICVAQLCSVIQGHPNCNPWSPEEILNLLHNLISIPPPIHREVCVTYLNRLISHTSMWTMSKTAIYSLQKIYALEQRFCNLFPSPEMPQLFLQLFCPCSSDVAISNVCNQLQKFPLGEVHTVIKYVLVLRGDSAWSIETRRAIAALHSIPPEERDFCVCHIQRINYGGIQHRMLLLNYLIQLQGIHRGECVDLMIVVMAQPCIHCNWSPDEIVALLAGIASLCLRKKSILCFQSLIEKSAAQWTAWQAIQLLKLFVEFPVIDWVDDIKAAMEQSGRRWSAAEVIGTVEKISYEARRLSRS